MATLTGQTIAASYQDLVKRADTYSQTGTNIELMDDSGDVQVTGLYLESGATTDNVGIGVADPDELLELYKVGTQLKLSGGAADYATFAVAADGALTITTVDADAAEADIILAPDGNVGIGTSIPGALLEVAGTMMVTGAIGNTSGNTVKITTGNVFGPSSNNGMDLGSSSETWSNLYSSGALFNGAADTGDVNIATAGNGLVLQNASQATRTILGLSTDNSVLDLYNSSNALTAKIATSGDSYFNGGNVGIGTTTPAASEAANNTLQLGSNLIIQDVVGTQTMFANNAHYDGAWKQSVDGENAVAMRFGAGGTINFHIASELSAGATLSTWDQSDIKLSIAATGNVGIGTTVPDGALEVSRDGANAQVIISAYDDSNSYYPYLKLRKADGTEADPDLVHDNDILGVITFQGSDNDADDVFYQVQKL